MPFLRALVWSFFCSVVQIKLSPVTTGHQELRWKLCTIPGIHFLKSKNCVRQINHSFFYIRSNTPLLLHYAEVIFRISYVISTSSAVIQSLTRFHQLKFWKF